MATTELQVDKDMAEIDLVAAGMLGLSPDEFRGMTHLAKAQYRPLAATLLQLFRVTAK